MKHLLGIVTDQERNDNKVLLLLAGSKVRESGCIIHLLPLTCIKGEKRTKLEKRTKF